MIFIDYNDKRPIYEQVTEKIQTLILNGVLEPDSAAIGAFAGDGTFD